VDQEYTTADEPNNQILAAPFDGIDDLALELCGDLVWLDRARDAWVENLDSLEAASHEHRLEVSANRLDLGELGHGASVAVRSGL
jgi:hypothetical protein